MSGTRSRPREQLRLTISDGGQATGQTDLKVPHFFDREPLMPKKIFTDDDELMAEDVADLEESKPIAEPENDNNKESDNDDDDEAPEAVSTSEAKSQAIEEQKALRQAAAL